MAAMRQYSHSKEDTYHEAGVESGKYSPQSVYSPHQTPRSGEGINISNQLPQSTSVLERSTAEGPHTSLVYTPRSSARPATNFRGESAEVLERIVGRCSCLRR